MRKERKYRDSVERLHKERWDRANPGPGVVKPEELEAAWHSLQLQWLREYPEYRALVRQRVSEAAKHAEFLSKKFDKQYEDRDYLGQEIEGCG